RETLSLLQIPAHKLIANTDYPYITARQLLVPHLASRITPDSCRFLRQQFLPHGIAAAIGPNPPARLYITRRAAATRKIINEAALIAYLETLGFCTVELESMPFQEQVALMSQATAVVAVHGSGLTNIVFCKPGTCVVELLSRNYLTPYYSFISKQVGLRYFCLLGENPEQREPGDYTDLGYMWEDIVIDLPALAKLLTFAELA
ncbi:MAG: glycosyltransferase family 61 protein, partial [Cyanobacteria bacterium]|nr:glycosyltransferase family 61 protein [Cyanobacteriota bacterium]MDW8203313.1 glycosyltransferase family 61 protein [Cyanobacteriota bacterium SKYGB_h_bin112]